MELEEQEASPRAVEVGPVSMHGETRAYACLRDYIEDLSDISVRTTLGWLLNVQFRGRPEASGVGQMAIFAFIRSSDKAIAEYEAARAAAAELYPSGPSSAVLRTLDHFDTCITSIARCYRLLPALKANLGRPGVPRLLRRQLEGLGEKYCDTRDAIEHIEGEISIAARGRETPLMLSITDTCNGVAVSNYSVLFGELASLLRKLHTTSELLMDYAEQKEASER